MIRRRIYKGAIIIAGLVHASCNVWSPVSQTADIVTDTSSDRTFIYTVEDEQLVRRECPTAAIVFDRSTCTLASRSVSFNGFAIGLTEIFSERFAERDLQVRSLHRRIAQIDVSLVEFLVLAEVDEARAEEILAAAQQLEADLGTLDLQVSDLEEQLASTRAEVDANPSSDLVQQIVELETEITMLKQAILDKESDLRSLRGEWIAMHASHLTQSTQRALVAQKRRYMRVLNAKNADLRQDLANLSMVEQTFGLLKSNVIFEIFTAEDFFVQKPVVAEFFGLFNRLLSSQQDGVETGLIDGGARHTCAIVGEQAVCFGHNDQGQLGDGTYLDQPNPVSVRGPSFASISTGDRHTCGLTPANEAFCWGDGYYGQLGYGGTRQKSYAWPVALDLSFTKISAGSTHTCAIEVDDQLYCWGNGAAGRLGIGSTTTQLVPARVDGLQAKDVSADRYHTCALDSEGFAYCWGSGVYGRLGTGDSNASLIPVPVAGGQKYGSIATTYGGACAIAEDHSAWCWGKVSSSLSYPQPSLIPSPRNFRSVRGGRFHVCFITVADQVQCIGDGYYGQLGTGSTTSSTELEVVSELSVRDIGLGHYHSCSINDRAIDCWGRSHYFQTGLGTTDAQVTPQTAYSISQ